MTGPAWVAFLVAAGLGAMARYLVDGWVQGHSTGTFPRGTLVVNVSGCLLLGLLTGLGRSHGLDPTLVTLAGTGGLGAYTTFSTFTVETVRLGGDGAVDRATGYVAATLTLGLLAAAAGVAVGTVL